MTKVTCTLVAALLVLAFSAQEVRAASVLDQEFSPATSNITGFVGLSNNIDRAQTFTVGITGLLTDVQVRISVDSTTTDPLLFDIRTTSGGAPTEADAGSGILFSTSIAPSAIGSGLSFFNVALGAGAISVSSGRG